MQILSEIREKYGDKIEVFYKSKKSVYITVALSDARDLVSYLYRELGARMQIATALDTRTAVEIIYHMAFDKENLVVSVRTAVEKPELEMMTFTYDVPAAMWIEREIHEMFGVNFKGHPNLDRLLLPDDWEEGVYPFRKKTFGSEHEGAEAQDD